MNIRIQEHKDTRARGYVSLARALVLVCACALLAAPSPALAAPGDLVPAFGTGGIVTTNAGGNLEDSSTAIAIDQNGNAMYVVGYDAAGGNSQWRIEKRKLDTGALITTFGSSGIVQNNPSTQSDVVGPFDAARAIDIDTAGNAMYIAGHSYIGPNTQWRIEKRRLDTGALITTFDGDGVVTNDPTAGPDNAMAIAIDIGGNAMYVTGYDWNGWRIEKRRLDTGALITAFDGDGIVTSDPSAWEEHAYAIAINAVGNAMYVAGYDLSLGNTQWRIEKRSLDTGALVTTFDGDGVVTSNPSSIGDWAYAIAIDQGANAMYVVGNDRGAVTNAYEWRIEKRRLDTGALITSFDGDGVVTSNTSSYFSIARGIVISSDGIYVVGYMVSSSDQKWLIEKRGLTDGSLISSYGVNGVVQTSFTDPGWYGMVEQPITIAIDSGASYTTGAQLLSPTGNTQWRIEKRELTTPPPPPPTVNLSAFPATINSGESTTLSWTSTDATSCDDVPLPEWISGPVGVSGSEIEWPTATTTYTISCTGPGGTTQQSTTVTVNVAPPPSCGGLAWDGTADSGGSMEGIAVDKTQGYVYAAGSKETLGFPGYLQKWSLDGAFQWELTNVDLGYGRYYKDIALGSAGIYLITDKATGAGSNDSAWRIERRNKTDGALDTSFGTGGLIPEYNPNTDYPSNDIPYRIEVIDSGSDAGIYVVGMGAANAWHLVKWSLDGQTQEWAHYGDAPIFVYPVDMVVDNSGIYVVARENTGYLSNVSVGKWRFDGNPTPLWEVSMTLGYGLYRSLAVDVSGVYIAGKNATDWIIEKRDLSNGSLINGFGTNGVSNVPFQKNPPSPGNNEVYGAAVDSSGLYLVGDVGGAGGDPYQGYIQKRNRNDGSLIWDVLVPSDINQVDSFRSITLDGTGLYLGGYDVVSCGANCDSRWRIQKRSLSCTGAPPPPTIDLFTATPSTINSGETSTLEWSTTGASSCTGFSPAGWITEGGGGGACSGTTSPFTGGCQIVQPAATTDYIIECYNAVGDPAQQTVRVTVNAPAGNDCGMRVYDGTATVTLDCENPATTTSLRIHKGGTTYGIKLVDPADPNASRIRIGVPGVSGTEIKALRKQ